MVYRIRRRWQQFRGAFSQDRGDVPGWVMIVVMTAGLVILIWALAGEALTQVFETAIDRILSA